MDRCCTNDGKFYRTTINSLHINVGSLDGKSYLCEHHEIPYASGFGLVKLLILVAIMYSGVLGIH